MVATVQWSQLFPQAYVNHLPRIHSDHAPILLRTQGKQHNQHRFKMENWWLTQEGFQQAWEQAWVDSRGESWTVRMETVRRRMTAWAREIQTPQNRLHTIQLRLQTLQIEHPTLQSPEEENMLLTAYNKAEEDLTEYWRQRSRLQWQTEGDKNTAFFHMVATNRRRTNLINYVTTETGALVTDEAGIRQSFVSFFKCLYTQPQQQPSQIESEQYF